MLPVLRLSLLTLAILLFSTAAAQAAKGLSVAVPAEGQVAVTVASGVKSLKVKSAPAGVTVTGGVKKGRLAVAVVRPRGVAAAGKVMFTVVGKAKGVKTFPAALSSGRVSAGCGDLAGLLGKRLKGSADVKALGAVLAAKLCGNPAPANAADVLTRLALGAAPAPPAPPAPQPSGGTPARPGAGPGTRPTPTATPVPTATATPVPGVKKACDNDLDDDGDGQTDWEDPGCSDAGDTTENSEIPAPAACAATSGIGMADDPTELTVGINPGCGPFWEAEVDVAPGVESCTATTTTSAWSMTRSPPHTVRRAARRGRHDAAAHGAGRLHQEGDDRAVPGRQRRRLPASSCRRSSTTARRSRRRRPSAPTARTTTATA